MSGYANDPNAPGYLMRPRLRALFNGAPINFPVSASVESNNHFQADRFTLTLVPAQFGVGSLQWWSMLQNSTASTGGGNGLTPAKTAQTNAVVAAPPSPSSLIDVQMALVPLGMSEDNVSAWTSLIQGEVDDFGYHSTSNLITIKGRDLTSRMIDTKTQNAYVNQTSSQIVTTIGQSHGLTINAKPTATLAGRYWDSEYDDLQLNQFHRVTTEWDLLCNLAMFENFDIWVSGSTLNFQPKVAPGTGVKPYAINWQIDQNFTQSGNVRNLTMSRSLTIAKGLRVEVKSWNAKQSRSFVRSAPPHPGKTPQNHIYIRPNLTEDQAQQLANSIYSDLVKHEMRISCEMPADLLLTTRSLISLYGTGTAFDQTYYPQSITRTISVGAGFEMRLDAKNENPTSQAQVL